MREAKAASHVLQTVWSYKELRGALQKDGWTKARFQVWPAQPFLSHFAGLAPPAAVPLTPTPACFLPSLLQSAAANAKGPKAALSSGGFDDSTLPLVDKSLGEYRVGLGGVRTHP